MEKRPDDPRHLPRGAPRDSTSLHQPRASQCPDHSPPTLQGAPSSRGEQRELMALMGIGMRFGQGRIDLAREQINASI